MLVSHSCRVEERQPRQEMMNITIDGDLQYYELADFSPVDSSSVWEVCARDDFSTVVSVKEEFEAHGSCDDSPPWGSIPAAPLKCASSPTPLKGKRSFRDILRDVTVSEETLQCAVARLGGGAQGLQVLMDHVNYWALGSHDEDVIATIRKGIVDFGMPPAPKRHCIATGSVTNGDAVNFGGPCFDADSARSHGAAYTRALRKSHIARQRGQTRPQRHHSMDKCGHQSRQWRSSGNNQWVHDLDPELGNANGKGYEFLFQKELRASDVSSLGRIVLPKKDAERHLPYLIVREGVMMSLEDYHSGTFWTVRYRFWPNNKSRMYLLESIGGFVTYHRLQGGDLLLCYRNGQGGYVIRGQKMPSHVKAPAKGPSPKGAQVTENTRTTEMKTVSTVMPPTHDRFLEEDQSATTGTDSLDLGTSSFYSMDYPLEEMGDGKDFEGGYSRQYSCVAQQMGYHTNSMENGVIVLDL